MKIAIPYTGIHSTKSEYLMPKDVFSSLDWQAEKIRWVWMNGEALCELLAIPYNKANVTALGKTYRKLPDIAFRKSNGTRLMLIPPLRTTDQL